MPIMVIRNIKKILKYMTRGKNNDDVDDEEEEEKKHMVIETT